MKGLASLTDILMAGNPRPRLEWTSRASSSVYSRLSSGEGRLELSLGQVSRNTAGSYTCSAHNGDGLAPVERTVIVQVQCEYS